MLVTFTPLGTDDEEDEEDEPDIGREQERHHAELARDVRVPNRPLVAQLHFAGQVVEVGLGGVHGEELQFRLQDAIVGKSRQDVAQADRGRRPAHGRHQQSDQMGGWSKRNGKNGVGRRRREMGSARAPNCWQLGPFAKCQSCQKRAKLRALASGPQFVTFPEHVHVLRLVLFQLVVRISQHLRGCTMTAVKIFRKVCNVRDKLTCS